MSGITDDEMSSLSDEERAALADDESTTTQGASTDSGDDDKDHDDAAADKGAAASDDDSDAAARDHADSAASGGDGTASDDDEEGDTSDDSGTQSLASPVLSAPDVDGFDDKISTLEALRKDVRAKYRAGDLNADDYDDQLDEIGRQISAIEGDKREAVATARYNRDLEIYRYKNVLTTFKDSVKTSTGIDYDNNPVLLDVLDKEIKTLAANDANEDKSYDWFLKTAHANVLAAQERIATSLGFVKQGGKGSTPANNAAIKTAVDKRRQTIPSIASLSTLPSAATESPGSTEFSHMDGLGGEDLENAVARMSKDQQDRWARA